MTIPAFEAKERWDFIPAYLLPPGGLPVQKQTKPNVPYRDFLGNLVPDTPMIEDDMKFKQITAIAALAMGTAACNSAASAGESVEANNAKRTSPLQNLLTTFVAPKAAAWSAFDSVPDVHWRDAKPLASLNANGPDMSHYRSGNLLLAGFGEVDIPDGKVGADAGTRKDNEGNVGVTLNGNVETVQSMALLKFYPSKNYQEILQNQLHESATIKVIAGTCKLDYGTTAPNTQMNTFYRIDMDSKSAPVFVEAYVDEDGGNQGPGYTYFVFYRNKPQQRLTAMHCKQQ